MRMTQGRGGKPENLQRSSPPTQPTYRFRLGRDAFKAVRLGEFAKARDHARKAHDAGAFVVDVEEGKRIVLADDHVLAAVLHVVGDDGVLRAADEGGVANGCGGCRLWCGTERKSEVVKVEVTINKD